MDRAFSRASITLAAALALPGCMKPNPLAEALSQAGLGDGDGDLGDGDPGDGDPGDGDPGDGDPGDGDPGDGDPGDGDPGDGDPGDGDPGDGDPSPMPDLGDGGGTCTPLDGLETECAACLTSSCCSAMSLCGAADGCGCVIACELGGGSPGECKNTCDAKPEDIPEYALLQACVDSSCADSC